MLKRFLVILSVLSVTILPTAMVYAQPAGYPSKPISLIIPFKAGGGSDIIARLLVSMDADYFGVNMIPVIKPGASGSIAASYVYHSKPDGYTLLFGAPHMITLLPQVRKVNYEPLKLIPVCMINQSNSIVITPKKRPWSTWEEFVAYAKKHPGKLSYGSTGVWGITHVRTAAIMNSLGLKLVHVPYSGGGELDQALIRGEVDLGISGPSHALTAIEGGDVRPLAISLERIKQLPGVRTLGEVGVDITMPIWRGIFAPPGTPKEIVDWLDHQFSMLVKNKSFKKMISKIGEDIVFMSGKDFAAKLKKENEQYGVVIKAIAAEEKMKKK